MTVSRPTPLPYAAGSRGTPWVAPDQARVIIRVAHTGLITWTVAVLITIFFGELLVGMLVTVIGLIVATVAILATALAWFCWTPRADRRRRHLLLLPAYPLVVITANLTLWPLHVSFHLSRPALDRLAAQVAQGKPPAFPARAGVFTITRSELTSTPTGPIVALWTPSSSTHIGFVESPPGVTPPYNVYTHTQMTPTWHHYGED